MKILILIMTLVVSQTVLAAQNCWVTGSWSQSYSKVTAYNGQCYYYTETCPRKSCSDGSSFIDCTRPVFSNLHYGRCGEKIIYSEGVEATMELLNPSFVEDPGFVELVPEEQDRADIIK